MSAEQSNDVNATASFFSDILKPGSSMHPTFLVILDVAFTTLLFVLLGLLYGTAGNFHILALILIELGLWASVKWFVYELRNSTLQQADKREAETHNSESGSKKDI